jgi:EmrB/QacA subfamily drug resistance transporter
LKLEYKYLVAIVSTFGLFMNLLDSTVVNVAIPTLATDFHASTTTIQWVITGYLLALAVVIPMAGWVGDRFGTKRSFMAALVVFTGFSLACGLAWNIESLIVFRILQGAGGGMLTPLGTTLLFRAFPPHERSRASALLTIPTTVAPASGPLLGGLLVEYVSWHWIFFVNVPIGIIGVFCTWRFLREQREEQPGRFDPAGFVLAAAGMGALLYGLSEAGVRGFEDVRVLGFLVSSVVILAVFTLVELRIPEPMLDLRLVRNRLFRACSVTQLLGMTGFAGSLFLLPVVLQSEQGLTPFQSGLATFPTAIGVTLFAQPTSRIYHYVGPRRLIVGGLLIAAVMTYWLALIDAGTSQWEIRIIMLLRGCGFGMILVSLQAATFATIRHEDTGRASSLFSAAQMVGQSLGVAVCATVLANRLAHHGGALGPQMPAPVRDAAFAAFHDAFLAAVAMTIVGIVVALLIRDKDAAPSMRPRGAVLAGDDDDFVEMPAIGH